jgi:hypothetical protein
MPSSAPPVTVVTTTLVTRHTEGSHTLQQSHLEMGTNSCLGPLHWVHRIDCSSRAICETLRCGTTTHCGDHVQLLRSCRRNHSRCASECGRTADTSGHVATSRNVRRGRAGAATTAGMGTTPLLLSPMLHSNSCPRDDWYSLHVSSAVDQSPRQKTTPWQVSVAVTHR